MHHKPDTSPFHGREPHWKRAIMNKIISLVLILFLLVGCASVPASDTERKTAEEVLNSKGVSIAGRIAGTLLTVFLIGYVVYKTQEGH
jgi:hypothetical protein